MKKILSLLMMTLLCVTAAWGSKTSSLVFTAKCNGSGTADDGAVWTVTSDGAESTFDGTSGIHYGTSNAEVTYLQLSTSGIPGTITNVVVNARDAQSNALLTVKVGTTSFTCSGDAIVQSGSQDFSFSGSGSGEIVVRLQRTESMKKALYVKSIVVTYEEGSETPPIFTLNDVPLVNEQNVQKGASVTINKPENANSIGYVYGVDITPSEDDYTTSTTSVNINTADYNHGDHIVVQATAYYDGDIQKTANTTFNVIDPNHQAQPGESVIFEYGTGKEFAQQNDEELIDSEKYGITVSFNQGASNNPPKWYSSTYGNARVYNGNSITISAPSIIESVTFTYEGSNALSSPNPNYGSFDNDSGVWTVGTNNAQLGITNTSRISTITVKLAAAGAVAPPTITLNPADGPYVEGTPVTVTLAAEDGATIMYALNTEAYETYSQDFTVSTTTTIKAKAVKNGVESVEVIREVEFEAAPTTVASIAEFNELDENTNFTFTSTVTVLGQAGNNLYVQDANKGMLIYGSTGQTYAFGDIIPAGFKGTKEEYNGAPRMKNPSNFDIASGNVAPTAIEMNIDDVTLANFGRYGVIKGATVSNNKITVDGQSVAIYNRFNVSVPTDGATYDVYGIASYYNAVQFLPLEFKKVETPVEFSVTVTPEAGEYTESVTVTITATDPEAIITYTLNGGDEIEYEAPFTLIETTAVHVYATNGTDEDTWDGTYTINIPVPVTLDGMIVFMDNDVEGSADLSSDGLLEQISNDGAKYVENVTEISKVFSGFTGLKFGSSKAGGSMTLNLKNQWNATKISFIAKKYGNDNTTFIVNGESISLSGDFERYEIEPSQPIQTITFETNGSNQRAYLKVIDIEGEEVTPAPTYTITLDNAPGNYTSNIVVKATVSELPEGAKLYYTFLSTGSTATAQEKEYKAGVKLFKSGTLTFILRDADNAELAIAGGEYTVPLFGDVDGDGDVSVTDVNTVVNVILGKLSMDVNE